MVNVLGIRLWLGGCLNAGSGALGCQLRSICNIKTILGKLKIKLIE